MTNVETLKTQVEQVKTELDSLNDLKKEASDEIIKTKTEALEKKVTTTKEAINKKLMELKALSEVTYATDIAKLEAMLVTLETSTKDLTSLKTEVLGSASDDKDKKDEKKDEKKDATKDKTAEDKNWLQKQRDGVTSKEEWKTNTGANVLRVAGGVAAVALVYKGIKWLFGGSKKDKEEKKDGEATEEPGFWKSTFGKVLKWTGIGTGAYYLIHGFSTGKWGLSDFFDRSKKEKINPDDLKDRYEKEIPEAMRTKYNKFGTTVDEYRTGLGNTDTLGTLKDDENKEVAIPKGAVPAAMDNAYDNVGDILDTNGDIKDTRARVGGKIWGLVSEVGGAVVGGLLKPFVGAIKGLKATMFGTDGEPNEEFQKRAETEDLTRDEQVANLMQKYSMVRSYLNDKRKQLKRKYIEEQLKTEGISNPTEEQIEDYDQDDELIEARLERDFLEKKIAAADDADSVIVALEGQDIYDTTASKETTAVLDEVKEIKKEIVPDETIWTRAETSPDINKDDTLRTELNTVSKNFGAHLKEGILQRNIIEGIANGFGILNLDELRNGETDDMEEAMEKLGFSDEVKRFALDNQDFYTKLQAKTLTKADITKFKTAVNDYFSLLQQVMVEKETQQENEGAGEFGTWFMGRMRSLVSTPTGWVIMGSAFVLAKSKTARTAVKWTINTATKPIKWILRPATRRINIPFDLGNRYLKLINYGNTVDGYDNFLADFKKGRMSYEEARYVYEKRMKMIDRNWPKGKTEFFESLLEDKIKLIPEQIKTLQIHLNNKNIQKILSKDADATLSKLADKLKTYDVAIESKEFKKLSDVQQKFCKKLFANAEFTSLDDIDKIVNNMEKIDAIGLTTEKELNKAAKAIGKDISTLTDADAINAKLAEYKKTVAAVDDAVKPATTTVEASETLVKSRKEITESIETEIKTIEREFEKAGSMTDTPFVQRYYENKVKGLKEFKTKAASFTAEETDAFKQLKDINFKTTHISELFALGKINTEVKAALDKGNDIDGLLEVLAKQKSTIEKAGGKVTGELITGLTDIKAAKIAAKFGNKTLDATKIFFKFLAKVIS